MIGHGIVGHHIGVTLATGRARGCAAALLASVAIAGLAASTASADRRAVTVMTQNLYQGTEFAHFAALAGTTPSFEEALAATTADYATYQATNFPERAKLIAAEVAQNQPDLIGLQEVATWHKGPFDFAHPFALPKPVSEDFTQELVSALAGDGQHYAVVSRHDNNFTLAFPVLIPPSFSCCISVGMVESGEILARTDLPPGQLKLSDPKSGTYGARIPTIPNPLVPSEPFIFTNSWQSIDVKIRGKDFRFITTHLDALAPGGLVSGPQAKELLAGPTNTSLPVIVTGDMNSGLTFAPAAYDTLVEGGLTDTWTEAGLGAPPLTCCHLGPNDLVNEPTATYSDDLDHVFTRGQFPVLNEHLVGNTPASPLPEPFIWPSDHAGMVATLRIAP
jgi:endonuclease/exonuclease/phosphatase family metal-dependent hydrolase